MPQCPDGGSPVEVGVLRGSHHLPGREGQAWEAIGCLSVPRVEALWRYRVTERLRGVLRASPLSSRP